MNQLRMNQGIAQEKQPPRGCWYEHETTWRPCLIITSSTSKNDVDVMLVNWKQPESTKNEPI